MTVQRGGRTSQRRRFLRGCCLAAGTGGVLGVLLGQMGFTEESAPPEPIFNERARNAIQKGLAYLASRQNEDGSLGSGAYGRNVAVCGLCGMAFLASGSVPQRGPYGTHVARCLEFILQQAQESGYIVAAEAAGRGPMYGHGFATLFLAEVYGASPDRRTRDALAKAVQLIVDTQNSEGGWRYEPRRNDADVSVTVCQVMALRAARNAGIFVPKETIDRSVEYVKRCQNPDGGFMYRTIQPEQSLFPRSAAALVALYSAGIYEGAEIQKGLDYLLKNPPRANTQGDQAYYFYGHYYAVQVMWHAGGKYWQTWYPAVRDTLLDQQRADGSWQDAISPEYGTAMAVLVLHMPSSYLPIFQR